MFDFIFFSFETSRQSSLLHIKVVHIKKTSISLLCFNMEDLTLKLLIVILLCFYVGFSLLLMTQEPIDFCCVPHQLQP